MCCLDLGGIPSECSRQKLTQETYDAEQKINHERGHMQIKEKCLSSRVLFVCTLSQAPRFY